jgi:hypothetical protein
MNDVFIIGTGDSLLNLTEEEIEYINSCDNIVVNSHLIFHQLINIKPKNWIYVDNDVKTETMLKHTYEIADYLNINWYLGETHIDMLKTLNITPKSNIIKMNTKYSLNKWAETLEEQPFWCSILGIAINLATILYPKSRLKIIGMDGIGGQHFYTKSVSNYNKEIIKYHSTSVISTNFHNSVSWFKWGLPIIIREVEKRGSEIYHYNKDSIFVNENHEFFQLNNDVKPDRFLKYRPILEFTINSNTCVCAISIEISDGNEFLDRAKKMIITHLEHTNYDIVLITNYPKYFNDVKNDRVKLINYSNNFKESILSSGRFNMHLKRYPIQIASEMGYENIFYNDCDCYITGWDESSFNNKCLENFDVAFVSHANPQLGDLRKIYPHFQEVIDTEFIGLYYDELDKSPNPAETRIIFKNNNKLTDFLYFWGLISKQNNNHLTYHDGIYIGTSSVYAKMKMIGITKEDEFSKYCRIQHSGNILNYFGYKID